MTSKGKKQEKKKDFMASQKLPEFPPELKELKDKLDLFSKNVLEKFDRYILGVTLLPPTKDKKEDINVLVVVDDSDSQKMSKQELSDKLGAIIASLAKEVDPNMIVQTWIVSEIWGECHDGKYDKLNQIAMSQPVYDRGTISGIKLSEVHKKMSLDKFEKYIVCYVCAGSHFRGDGHEKSDIDAFVVIDDTDVKRMSRGELKDKLTAIMYDMAYKAAEITGVKIKLHVQTYLLTDFWDSIKDANPVIFTFLRDGIPFYDRGMYMPWKQLLKMGKIKPSAESIDMFQNSGEQFLERAKNKILSAGVEDAYYAILNPSQAALMMYGINPTTPRETARLIKEVFVDKEKMLEKEYGDIIDEQVQLWKSYEYDEVKSLDGSKAERLIKNVERYLKRIKELYGEIEKKKLEETVLHANDNVVAASRDVLKLEGVKKVSAEDLPNVFQEKIINAGIFPDKTMRVLKQILKAKVDYPKGTITKQDVENIRKDAHNYIKFMVEYMQRKRANEIEKSKIKVKFGDKYAEIIMFAKGDAFILYDANEGEKEIRKAKVTEAGGLDKIDKSDMEEFERYMGEAKFQEKIMLKSKIFEDLKSLFGNNVEIMVNN
ncbi:hypothetical protein COV93_06830 [Candidatus Woesearchaeota archaeon CG11_big_fil_rev_8_21_14_0_20_43_8]|nr:MAG: hypothetical protein COV93_06830 [Candidatus Woesearchaeota archaeon CG11_big_fil_rev_8_21_14_0_20_43_8]PIO05192.1 MAG: hypothetical protein COT47_05760 [Candidatus Woesearchaeota archaeon CG08_land_8_20_14_0_20_43_7]